MEQAIRRAIVALLLTAGLGDASGASLSVRLFGPKVARLGANYGFIAEVSNSTTQRLFVAVQPAIAGIGKQPSLPYDLSRATARVWVGNEVVDTRNAGEMAGLGRASHDTAVAIPVPPGGRVRLHMSVPLGRESGLRAGKVWLVVQLVGYEKKPETCEICPEGVPRKTQVPVLLYGSDQYRMAPPSLLPPASLEARSAPFLFACVDGETEKP